VAVPELLTLDRLCACFMKLRCTIWLAAISLTLSRNASGQTFQDLNFESADVSGYAPGSSDVPINAALPGWTGAFENFPFPLTFPSQIWYDAVSPEGAAISINDTESGFVPIQGTFSVDLFGTPNNLSAISQTGLIPLGTKSLLMDVSTLGSFRVWLGDQTVSMTPLQTFSNYILYGADISAFAGQIETLGLGTPLAGSPNGIEFDSIIFSPASVPEPTTLILLSICISFLCWPKKRSNTALEPTATAP